MSLAADAPIFVSAAAVSLGSSWLLVSRLERVGERLGLSEALLGVLASLAGDCPEITSAVTAISHHQAKVGAGVVLGSCAFNLAALLGFAVVLTGRIRLHRRAVALTGSVSAWAALVALGSVTAGVTPQVGLAAAGAVLLGYLALLRGGPATTGGRLRAVLPARASVWLRSAVAEEMEPHTAIRPVAGGAADALVAAASLAVVVVASVVMEQSATSAGARLGVSQIVVGTLVLGAVTGIPNAVASTYLARQGRAAAALSTALNSNNFNIVLGLLVPATIVGLGRVSGQSELVAAWCLGLTVVGVLAAHRGGGLRRGAGWTFAASYAAFAVCVVAVGRA
ncbi:MAG: hypothetical protein ACRDYY_10070 [Acidimicrobiales bacterium]